MDSSGKWLENALLEICSRVNGVNLDANLISGLVSFCELAPPDDAADYIANIIGLEAGQDIIQGYLRERGYINPSNSVSGLQSLSNQVQPSEKNAKNHSKKTTEVPKDAKAIVTQEFNGKVEHLESRSASNGDSSTVKKKKTGKVISLSEAAKGSVVFHQGKPCTCQARRHKLVSNCLSCGKIVCEQEGEGPCSFCGALVLREGSSYAGLDDITPPCSDLEASAVAYAKRLVDYDRHSAARTTVIDDQSDYYEIEGNNWLSKEERQLIIQKQQEIDDAYQAQKGKVVITFDLAGRKVFIGNDQATETAAPTHGILSPADKIEETRMRPNPYVKVHPIFVDPGHSRASGKVKENKIAVNGLCLSTSGRVQHEDLKSSPTSCSMWQATQSLGSSFCAR